MSAATLIEQLAIYQSQLTIITGLVGLAGTLLSQKMRDIYSWPFRMFHKAFGNRAMEDKLDYLIQELTYDESGKTLKTAVKDIAQQMEDLADIFKERGLAIAEVSSTLADLKSQVEAFHSAVDDKNSAITAKFVAMLDQPHTPPIIERNSKGEVIWVSASFITMTGRPLSELLGWGWTNAVHPEDVQEVREAWELCIRDVRVFEHTYRYISTTGIVTKVKCRATPIIHNQQATGWVSVFEVLPKRKHSSNADLLFIG
jgi:PAS domain S-box-containing protein